MELLTLAAIIAGIIAAIIGLIVVMKKVSAFYKLRFQFSIWSGVLLFVVAFAMLLISASEGVTRQTAYILLAVAALFAILAIYNDIRLAGLAWGGISNRFTNRLFVVFCFFDSLRTDGICNEEAV